MKTRDLFETWRLSVEGEGREYRSIEEQDWAATELRNSLRSIEWDLEASRYFLLRNIFDWFFIIKEYKKIQRVSKFLNLKMTNLVMFNLNN